ncbi:hypothetical protein FE249_08325 [Acidiphilium multivorum]|jgi:hypothetical protein|nr:hypothetical protein FE249_08325 [Acidiphilium multivorum]
MHASSWLKNRFTRSGRRKKTGPVRQIFIHMRKLQYISLAHEIEKSRFLNLGASSRRIITIGTISTEMTFSTKFLVVFLKIIFYQYILDHIVIFLIHSAIIS